MNKYVKVIGIVVGIYILILLYILLFPHGLFPKAREARYNFLNNPSPYIYNGVNFFNGESLYDNIMKTESAMNQKESYEIDFSEINFDNEYEERRFYVNVSKNPDFTIESWVIFYYHDANGELISHEYNLDLTPEGFKLKDGNPSQEEIEYITTTKAPSELICIEAPTLKDLKKENRGIVDTSYYFPFGRYYSKLSGVKLNLEQYNAYLTHRHCKPSQNPVTIEEETLYIRGTSIYSKDKSLYMYFSPIGPISTTVSLK